MHLAWRYSVEIALHKISGVDKKLVDEYVKRFRSGESIDKMFLYLTMFRHLANRMGSTPTNKSNTSMNNESMSIYRELAMCICGLCTDAKHGKLYGKPYPFFKPYKFAEGCIYLKTIVVATIVCCEINDDCRECVDIAKQLITNYISECIMYPTKIRFNILRDRLVLDIEIYEHEKNRK